MHSTIWKIFAIGCAVAIKLPTQNTKNETENTKKKVLQTKQNETEQNKRQAAVISNHNNCSEMSNKKQTKRERERGGRKKGRETQWRRVAVNELIKTLLPNDRYTGRIRN